MAITPSEIRVGANGSVHVAPVGTALPVEPGDALDALFVDLGANNEDGVALSPSRTVEQIRAWQSRKPVRSLITEDDLSIAFSLLQWNDANVKLALGGGTIAATPAASGAVKYTPPAGGELDERSFIVKWEDDGHQYVLVVPRGLVTEVSDIVLNRSNASELALTVEVQGSAPDDFFILTDDPAWS